MITMEPPHWGQDQWELMSVIALLVTDYHLQAGETGTQVIAAVRATLGRDLHAVLITGDTSSTVRDLGASERVHLVSKPIQADLLLKLLKTLLPA